MCRYRALLSLIVLLIAAPAVFGAAPVRIWEQDIVIPTYPIGPAEPNPMFYFGRVYQGARGAIYPYPLYDKLTDRKEDKTYKAVYLENEYVKICVLPELGGRIFEAVDKTNNYDFFYRQHVIKPSLIGMLGSWISGGVEWNVPHHHRASSFMLVQHKVEENADGSKTVWIGELELRHRMRWAIGLTLRPGRSYLEASFRLLNRTPLVQSLLCFANVAVHTNENYQIIFPPSTQFITQHAKREFSRWPVGDSSYAGIDYRGVDETWWKNHPNPVSMFAWNYEDDFVAGYDHGKQAGTMSVADHNVVPGKKFFAWGNGPAGEMWDKILSDEDGPYLELMVGAYSDNQPDYSWIQPYEAKSFKQYWYPFRNIGGVKNANLDASVNLEVKGTSADLGFYTTAAFPDATVLLKAGEKVVLEEKISIAPDKPYTKKVSLPAGVEPHTLRASLSAGGRELIGYTPVRVTKEPMPAPVEPPPPPKEVKTTEELYLAGLRLEQFHSPALDPDPYYEEALNRDPGDSRANVALGTLYLKRGRFADAEKLFRSAIARLSKNYTSPKDGEAYYYLGVALKMQGKLDEAYTAFYKGIWSAAWQPAGWYSLAEIAAVRGDMPLALDFADRAIASNAMNTRAINLKAAILRKMGRSAEAVQLAKAVTDTDPLDMRAVAERWLADKKSGVARELRTLLAEHPNTGLETAVELGNAGMYDDAIDVLREMASLSPDRKSVSPMVFYYLGYYADKVKRPMDCRKLAATQPAEYVFPFQLEAIAALRHAMEADPKDARAPYYLGNLLFDLQPETAVELWEKAQRLDPSFPVVHRNLALAYARQEGGLDKAIASLEKAISLNGDDPVFLFELDQMYETAGASPEKRLAMLEKRHETVLKRDDAISRYIELLVLAGRYDDAIGMLQGRTFHIWEGGARFGVHGSWVDAHVLRGQQRLATGKHQQALEDFQAALDYPQNLQTARPKRGGRFPEIYYHIGMAQEAMGNAQKAREAWQASVAQTVGRDEDLDVLANTATAMRYYQARSLEKLGEKQKATRIYQALLKSGNEGMKETSTVDYFAKFGERQSRRAKLANAHFTLGLGYLGTNDRAKAKREFAQALEQSPDHLAAKTNLSALD